MVSFSEPCVINADGLAQWGKVGSPILGSRFFRDYCYMSGCGEPIRVPLEMIGFPNACSFCRPAYRGTLGIAEAERIFWIKQYLDEVEVMSA